MGKKVVISQDKLLVLKENVVGGNKAANHNAYYVNEARPEIDKYEIGAESNNPPLGGNGYHVEENLSEVREIPRELIDMAIKYKDNKYANWCVIDDVYVNMVPRYFEKKSFAVDYKRWLGRGILVNLAKYENNVNEDYSRNKLRYYNEGIKPQGNDFYENKKPKKQIVENKYDELYNKASSDFMNFMKQGALKYGDNSWYVEQYMKFKHPEIKVDPKDIKIYKALEKKHSEIFKLWNEEENREEEESKKNIEYYDVIPLAVERYGITSSLSQAGYILPDGNLLSFGQDGYRDVDHRAIEGIYKENNIPIWSDEYRYNYVVDFMNHGAIRCDVSSGILDMTQEPTNEQYSVIKAFVRKAVDVDIDFTDDKGNTLHSASYSNAKPQQVVADIMRYYNEGIKPQGNVQYEEKKTNGKSVITESQESKSIAAAKKLVMQRLNYNEQEADEFIRIKLRNDIPSLRTPQGGKFILGVARMFCDGELRSANDIGNLNSTLKLVASNAHINEYDRNLNGMSAQELIQRFAKAMSDNLEAEKNEIGQMVFNTPSDYEIVRIDSFEQAEEYGDYVSWCVTHDESMFDSYTSNGINQFYFCLKNGFENVEPQPSEGCPLDEYGLSMIAVSVNENGMLNTCTCRWNHDNGGNDGIMNAKQVSQVIGMNFFDVFKPNNKWKELLTSAMQRLDNGENPIDIFDYVDSFREGFARVKLNDKWNFINQEDNLLSKQWFDHARSFKEGFAEVKLNNKCNFINQEGRLLSKQWFDEVDNFSKGFVRVKFNGKYNFINREGGLISDQWFDDASSFSEGFARVELDARYNFINQEGRLLSKQWFDVAVSFREGFAVVVLNDRRYKIDTNGKLSLAESNNWSKKISISESQLKTLKENFDFEVDSSEIDLSSFKKRHELVPNVWKPSGELNSRIRLKLLDIADDFWKYVNITWVDPKGIILTGSICNFNWSKYSDVDLHLIVDFNEVDEKTEFVKDYLDSKKNEWNNEHKGLEIMGYKVELYVQDIDETPQSNGIYDLEKNEWVKEPNPNDIEPIGLSKYQIKDKAAEIMTIIDNMYDDLSSTNDMHKISEISDDADYLWEKIKKMRSASLEKDGEMGNGNIVYKYMRRKGYLDKLWNLRTMCYDKENSINEGVQYDVFRNNQSARYKLVYDMAEDGYVFHGTGEDGNGLEWDTVDPTKIRGGSRGTYGYGIYFTDHAYKCEKYTTYEDGHYIIANINGFNIINLKERVNKEHNIFLNKQNEYYLLQDKLDKARNNREYDRISSMIDEYNSTVDKKLLNAIIEVIEKSDENDLTYFYLNDNIPLLWYSDGDPKKQLSELYLSLGIDGFKYDTEFVIFNFDKLNKSIVKDKESLINKYIEKSIPWFNEKNIHLGESVKKYIKLLKQNIINEETVADGSSNSNPYKDRWKAEREALKNYICNYGTVMQSKEDNKGGKLYKVFYDRGISQLIGYNYALCVQWDEIQMKPKSIVYIRALDKFTPNIRRNIQYDTRGFDNVQGTYDDRRF